MAWITHMHCEIATGVADTVQVRLQSIMQVAVFAMRVLELMFFVGLAGSAIVILISFVEDAKELFGKE